MTQTSEAIRVSHSHHITTITLNNPPMNPIGIAQVEALQALLPTLAKDKDVRAIVIKGAGGKNFSVGANLKEGHLALEHGPKAFVEQRINLFNQIEALPKPVIAAINGYCLGGGMELAMSCHFRIAASSAELGLPEVDLGVAPLWSGASRVLRLVGRANALDILLRGHRMPASKALSLGLVNEVVEADQLEGAAQQLAQELAEKPPLAVAAIIKVVNRSQDLSLQDALADELEQFSSLSGTKDNIEGVTALFEKRKPTFIGE